MVSGESRGTVKSSGSTLEQVESVFTEGRADGTVDPEGLRDELLRQPGLEDEGGLAVQRRHFGDGGERGEKRRLEMMRT